MLTHEQTLPNPQNPNLALGDSSRSGSDDEQISTTFSQSLVYLHVLSCLPLEGAAQNTRSLPVRLSRSLHESLSALAQSAKRMASSAVSVTTHPPPHSQSARHSVQSQKKGQIPASSHLPLTTKVLPRSRSSSHVQLRQWRPLRPARPARLVSSSPSLLVDHGKVVDQPHRKTSGQRPSGTFDKQTDRQMCRQAGRQAGEKVYSYLIDK
ncbi:hypothetical protein IWX90DRAFT_9845 [Phyllosticta citrichinensis]|uniref:Uncharacterized protein n=1 Tax=Phyllosticta citrichinensis TaxID=1130410 RepID=A0ABR1Y5U9_9PEZI